MNSKQKNILLLCADAARHIGTVDFHIKSFGQYSRHNVVTLDSHTAGQMDVDVHMFDAIVFHYSIVISLPQYLANELLQKISTFNGPKILFIQDEYRWVDRTSETAEKLGISVVFTVVNKDVIRKIYRNDYFDNVRFEQTLTGFIPENLLELEVPDYQDRPLDIGYRARKLPAWCGSFALQKWQIGKQTLETAKKYDLQCDIAMSEDSRIYGDDWIKFMSSCRATLGTESGASFVDYTGLVYQEIDKYEAANPEASFEEVRDKYLEGRDNEVVIHVISPRVFEAAALRVLMILYPGTYSGVAKPGRHYVELLPDHSNMDEVVAILRDPERAGEIIENAYKEIACSQTWTHRSFIEHFDNVSEDEFQKHARESRSSSKNIDRIIDGKLRDLEAKERRDLFEREAMERKILFDQEASERRVHLDQEIVLMDLAVKLKKALRRHRRMRVAVFFQKIIFSTYKFIENKLPKIFSIPLLFILRIASRMLKPLLKKVLL
ncbi:MAG: glycosyltransferase [Hyphomicrobiaceae bacterium]|nr:glycosyltransferase [Hyphomicrobiaceae bacterium]